jgi:uncharacterized protein (DUF427 family)
MNTFNKIDGRVTVSVDGVTVADSEDVIALQEGSLPTRYYFPKSDVKFDLLEPTETHTRCGWKGLASYWTIKVDGRELPDAVWAYEDPLPGAETIAGRVCFYNERVELEVVPA